MLAECMGTCEEVGEGPTDPPERDATIKAVPNA
jgi:hypothetical protein